MPYRMYRSDDRSPHLAADLHAATLKACAAGGTCWAQAKSDVRMQEANSHLHAIADGSNAQLTISEKIEYVIKATLKAFVVFGHII